MKMKYFTLLFFCSLFVGCSDETSTSFVNNQNQQARDTIDNEDDNSWVLIFADEFNIDGAVDSKKWNYTPRGDVALPIIISRMIHPLFGVKMAC